MDSGFTPCDNFHELAPEMAEAILLWRNAVDEPWWRMGEPTEHHDPFIHALWNVSEKLRAIGATDA